MTSANIDLPPFPSLLEKTDPERLADLEKYTHKLAQYLNWYLNQAADEINRLQTELDGYKKGGVMNG